MDIYREFQMKEESEKRYRVSLKQRKREEIKSEFQIEGERGKKYKLIWECV